MLFSIQVDYIDLSMWICSNKSCVRDRKIHAQFTELEKSIQNSHRNIITLPTRTETSISLYLIMYF